MSILAISEVLGKLPAAQLEQSLHQFLQPLTNWLPDSRLSKNVAFSISGIVAAQSPRISQMARMVPRTEASTRAASARFYRLVHNKRVGANRLLNGLYALTAQTIAAEKPSYLVVALDPVNFEKPYTAALPGVSKVHKATPPNQAGQARIAKGYPALTASIVNTVVPGVTYANWFSYTLDFVSQNHELHEAVLTTRRTCGDTPLRWVADAGLDDQKIFAWFRERDEFVIRLCHLERKVEVYNERLKAWEAEEESLEALVGVVLWQSRWQVEFNHAGVRRLAKVAVGSYRIRLPETKQEMWVLVAEEETGTQAGRRLVLGTNVALTAERIARQVYNDWRRRGRIEEGYRFEQEAGLDVEAISVRDMEGRRCLFALVLIAAQFVYNLSQEWPSEAVVWLRELGGRLSPNSDRGGVYIFLQGLVAVYQTWLTLS
jgi:hypothetical protein